MVILAFLQNQWFKDPARIAEIYARRPDLRRQLNARFLFAGCMTGRRLRKAFGDLCNAIEWEEVSRQVASESSGAFPPDPDHVRQVLDEVKPDVVVVFGKIAEGIVPMIDCKCVVAPHPAARGADVPARLQAAADQVRNLIAGSTEKSI